MGFDGVDKTDRFIIAARQRAEAALQAIGEFLTSRGEAAPTNQAMVGFQFQGWMTDFKASGRVLRENGTTFIPLWDQPLQIHGGCLASDSVSRGDGHIQPLPDRLAPGQRMLGLG